MPKNDYIKGPDDAFSAQLQTFKTNIGSYATLLNVTTGEVTSQAADADYFAYQLACQDIALAYGQQCTAWKDLIRDGGTPPASGAPAMPVWPDPVTAVAPGIEPRFRALVQKTKKQTAYNPGIGEVLGIEGNVQSGPDFSTFRPVIDVMLEGGAVKIEWGWQGQRAFLESIRIEVDRGDGQGWRLLTIDTTPGYVDTQAFPNTPVVWKYRAIYRVGDSQVGQWSQEASITVGG